MVIYFDNRHAAPLSLALKAELDVVISAEEREAINQVLERIEQEKQNAPYRLWLKSHPTQEITP